jgi:hypothetical protein
MKTSTFGSTLDVPFDKLKKKNKKIKPHFRATENFPQAENCCFFTPFHSLLPISPSEIA